MKLRKKARTFYWVSQLGMLAGTVVYVNAGTQLARIESLAGIASPALLASFALLGLFPLIARKLVALVKANKVYARWTKPRRFDRNLVVIGGGSAGLVKQGIRLNKILGTIHIYPTLAEANKYVAGVWKRAHAPENLLHWVGRFHAWQRGG